MKHVLLIATAVGLAACGQPETKEFAAGDSLYSPYANMSRGQCGAANWREKGRAEGLRGAPREIIQSYYGFCEKHGEPPDEALFYEGYEAGLRQRQANG